MFEYIDKYCERISPDLWGEPFNIISNLAYIVASVFLIRLYQRSVSKNGWKNWDIQGLILLLILIGTGSSLWHISANSWALYADVIPILLFINLYLLSCLYRVLGYSVLLTAEIFLFYHLVNYNVQTYFEKDLLNGSIFYLPTWLLLFGIGLLLWRKQTETSKQILSACLIFALALFIRTIDLDLCHIFPVGTHFIWHILSAYMMYLLMRVLILPLPLKTVPSRKVMHLS